LTLSTFSTSTFPTSGGLLAEIRQFAMSRFWLLFCPCHQQPIASRTAELLEETMVAFLLCVIMAWIHESKSLSNFAAGVAGELLLK
jgi:hypothetical protein